MTSEMEMVPVMERKFKYQLVRVKMLVPIITHHRPWSVLLR